MVLPTVVGALWAMLPAYLPNNVAVLAGGGHPIDAGRTWRGKRLLGDGKTWRGTALGVGAGVALAIALNAIRPPVAEAAGFAAGVLPAFPIHAAVALAAGAMLGDMAASFVKRRTGRQRGAAVPGLDQLDFVAGALALAALLAPEWFARALPVARILVVVVLTPVLHVGTNAIAHWLGLKDEPW